MNRTIVAFTFFAFISFGLCSEIQESGSCITYEQNFDISPEPTAYEVNEPAARELGAHLLKSCQDSQVSADNLRSLIESDARYKEILEFVMEFELESSERACSNLTPLMLVLTSSETEPETKAAKLRALLEAGADPNHRCLPDGRSPFAYAADQGLFDCAEILIEYAADVNCIDRAGFTPLLQAFNIGDPAMIKFLLSKDASTLYGLEADNMVLEAFKAGLAKDSDVEAAVKEFRKNWRPALPVDYPSYRDMFMGNLENQQNALELVPKHRKLEIAYELGFIEFLKWLPIKDSGSVSLRNEGLWLNWLERDNSSKQQDDYEWFQTGLFDQNLALVKVFKYTMKDFEAEFINKHGPRSMSSFRVQERFEIPGLSFFDNSCLALASIYGNIDLIQLLTDVDKLDMNYKLDFGLIAIFGGSLEMFKLITRTIADVRWRCCDAEWQSRRDWGLYECDPLSVPERLDICYGKFASAAIRFGRLDILKYLHSIGRIDIKKICIVAADTARFSGHHNVLEFLEASGYHLDFSSLNAPSPDD